MGGLLRLTNFRPTVFDPAVRAAGLDGLTPHGTAHCGVTGHRQRRRCGVVRHILGHASATLTLGFHEHLDGDRLDEVADRIDALRPARGPAADSLRTKAESIVFPELDQDAAGR